MIALVEVAELSKQFRSTVALDGVTLRLEPGVTGLLGPNGAGKTTLLRILATVLAPDRGEVRLLGRRTDSPTALRAIRQRPATAHRSRASTTTSARSSSSITSRS